MRARDYIRAIDAQISEAIRVEDLAHSNLSAAQARTKALRDVKDAVEKAAKAAPKRKVAKAPGGPARPAVKINRSLPIREGSPSPLADAVGSALRGLGGSLPPNTVLPLEP